MAKKDKASKPKKARKPREQKPVGDRVNAMHEAYADYVNEQFADDSTVKPVTAEQVFAVISSRVAFRKTDVYQNDVKAAREQAKADAQAKKEQRAKEREEKKAAAKEKKAAKAAEKGKGKKGKKSAQDALAETGEKPAKKGKKGKSGKAPF